MNCDKCAWYVRRELNEIEKDWLRQHPGHLIDTHFCTLGGCDGGMFRAASGEEMRGTE